MSEVEAVPQIAASVGPGRESKVPTKSAPRTVDQLRECLIEATSRRSRVAVLGAGLNQYPGGAQDHADLKIATEELSQIMSYEPADMTITVEAGVTLAALQAALGEHGQFLPLDPVPGDGGTIGGLLAANVSGPLRHRYGTARDWLLGLRAVLADGSVIKSGGRVVKNVSGYDLHKVFVGSLGTLGVIAEATFKVAPLPRVDRTFSIACGSASEATGVIASAHDATLALLSAELLSPTAASVLTGAGGWTALVRVGGGAAATARTTDDLHDLASLAHATMEERDADIWALWRTHFAPGTLGLRVSVMPSRAGEVAESLDRAFAGDAAHISATVTAGLIRLNVTPRDDGASTHLIDRTRTIALQRGGFVLVDRAPTDYTHASDVSGPERRDIDIMRRLKREFDPMGVLAPGAWWSEADGH